MKKNSENKKKGSSFSVRRVLHSFSGVKIPWLLMLVSYAVLVLRDRLTLDYAYISADILDASGEVPTDVLWQYVIALGASSLITIAFTLLNGYGLEKISMGMRNKLWRRLIRLPQSVYDQDNGESLVSRVTSDCEYAGRVIDLFFYLLYIPFSMWMYIEMMFQSDHRMALAILLLIPYNLLVAFVMGRLNYWVGQKTQNSLAGATAYLVERTRNLQLIKAAGTYERERKAGRQAFEDQYKAEMFSLYASLINYAFTIVTAIVQIAIPFGMGAVLVSQGVMSVGEVLAFYTVTEIVCVLFETVAGQWSSLRLYVGSLKRVTETLEQPAEELDQGMELDVPDADIRMEEISFGYEEAVPVLQGLTCRIPKGKVTAVIGANGSGKTTLFRLLERLYQPGKGGLFFGKVPAESYKLGAWRRAFALVAQDCPVIEGTIRENIVYGCTQAVTDEELHRVAEAANVLAFAKQLPNGLDSEVAPGGRNLSGGQRQCIAIARALMNNPDYLLLDEATSSLDAKSERMVSEAMHQLMEGRTTVIIAHNLSAVRHADYVLVLKNGRVAAEGTPDMILKTSEEYREFVECQQGL